MRIFPIENNLYFRWEDVPEKMGNIVIPKGAAVAMRRSEVMAVGPTCEIVKVGDKVLTSIYTGVHLFLCMEDNWTDGEKHRMCREDELIAIYTNTDAEAKDIEGRDKQRTEEFNIGKKKKLEE